MTTGALTKVDPEVSLGLVSVRNPVELLTQAAAIATELAKVIENKKLFKMIGTSRHVYCEGWTTMIAMLGLTAQEKETVEREGSVFVATVELVTIREGMVVGRASAQCGGPDEPDWHQRPKYEWKENPETGKRERQQVGLEDVPANARRSMAQTRAAAKACRLAFSWIMVLANYDPTPAEEAERMPGMENGDGHAPRAAAPAAQRRPAAAVPDLGGRKVRKMRSKFASTCAICNVKGNEGDEIAYAAKEGDLPAFVAHWSCWEGAQRAAAAAAAKPAQGTGNGPRAAQAPAQAPEGPDDVASGSGDGLPF